MFFKTKTFRERAFQYVEREIARCLYPDAASQALSAFVAILRVDTDKHGLDIDVVASRFEREFRNPDALAMTLVDHVISQMKAAREAEGEMPDSPWPLAIARLEAVLDANPGVIIPKNGRIGRIMSSPEMAHFVTDGRPSSSNWARVRAELSAALAQSHSDPTLQDR